MKVYWAPLDNKEMNLTLAYYEPGRLATNIPVDLRSSGYYKCPAFMETVKNTFVLKSPISLNLEFNPSKQIASASNEQLYNLKARIDDALDHGIVQFGFNYLFFAEKPLKITQMHPYLHHNTFTRNANTLLGEFDCGRWLRPLQASFVIDPSIKDYTYDIKRGDIYSYIRFNTDEKVELVNFDLTPKIEEIADSCLQMKQSGHNSSFSLDFCYKSFIMYKRNKVLLRELRAQGL
jgi:hypothetical protein